VPPLVSVIIPTYNRAGIVSRAVQSVLDQTFRDFELIVVDDGSTDQTADVLSRYETLPGVSIITQKNKGVSSARNAGLTAASGQLIAFLDSDDYWLPDKLEVQANFFERRPEALICQTEETWYRRGRRVNPKKYHRKPSGDIFFQSLELCLVSPSAVMMRRELFDLVGTFDEGLPACEDYDLWLRVSARYPVHLLDEPCVIKTGGHPDQLSSQPGLDRYRIQTLLKIIESGQLSSRQKKAAGQTLATKARIYGQGCVKRGKTEEGQKYLEIAKQAGTGKISGIFPLAAGIFETGAAE